MKWTNFKSSLLITVVFVVYLFLGAGIFFAIEKDAEETLDAPTMFLLKVVSEKQMAAIQMGMTKAVPKVTQAYKAKTQKDAFDENDVQKIAALALDKVLQGVRQKMAAAGGKTGEPQASKHSANGDTDPKTENMSEQNPSYNSVQDLEEEARVKRQAVQNASVTTDAASPATPTPSGEGDEHHDSDEHKHGFGSFVYLGLTSLSTIGFGNIHPKTTGGRVFFMFYCIGGIPMYLFVMFALALANRRVVISMHSRLLQALHRESMSTFAKNLTRFLVVFTLGFLVLVLMCAAIFQHVEGWEYIDALYFEVGTLTTVGFGDLYPGLMLGLGDPREVSRGLRGVYMVFVFCYIVFGIGWVFTLALMAYDCCTTKHQTKEISQANGGVSTPPKVKVEKEDDKAEDVEKTEQPLLNETEPVEDEKEMEEIKHDNPDNSV